MTDRFDLARLRHARPRASAVRRIVQGALAHDPRRRRAAPFVLVSAVAALMFLLSFLRTKPLPVTAPPSLSTGSLAQASQKSLRVTAGRHEVVVAEESLVRAERVEPRATELRVERGGAHFRVSHLSSGERFRVEVGGMVVEAVGTRFAVELEGPCARVQVSEGTVRIERAGRPPELQSIGGAHTYCPGPPGREVFSEEERLVSYALEEMRRGGPDDLVLASDSLRRYHERFPEGVYSQEALYYLARIAARLDKADEATHWAKLFLERFPRGGRADELRELVR